MPDKNDVIRRAYDLAEGHIATGRYDEASRVIAALLSPDANPNPHHLRLLLEEIVAITFEPTAHINLAIMLLTADSGEHDAERAFELLSEAVDGVEPDGEGGEADRLAGVAHETLADLYLRGDVAPADPETAFRHYLAAAELGRGQAAHNVAVAFEQGLFDQPVDRDSAKRYLNIAADAGVAAAMTSLALMHLDDLDAPDEVRVMDLLEQARDLGDERAAEVLEQLREDTGLTVPEDE